MSLNIKKDFSTSRSRKPDLSTMVYGKVPPQNPELEEAVLGAILLDKTKLGDVNEIIQSPECFYVDANKKIYAAILSLNTKGLPVDLLTITEELRKNNELELVGGAYYLTKLTMNVVSSAHVESHALIVMEKYIQRELIRISGEVIGSAYEEGADVFELMDKAEQGLYEITDKHLRKNYVSIDKVLLKTIDEIEAAKNKTDDLTGVPSGYYELDKMTGGWQKTDLIVIAARPAVGKTAFCLNLAMNAALNTNKAFPVAFFSLEMSASQLVKRMLSAVTEVRMDAITKGRMEEHEFVQLTKRMSKLSSSQIYLDDQAALNVFELRAKARRLKQHHGIELIVIDYLQLMQASIDKNGNREQEISKISRDLKALAKELEVPIIALSQLNRGVESRKDSKIPQLSDLRESGAIEQDADMVIFLYRPEYHGVNNDEMGEPIEGKTEIHIAKHRNGSTGKVDLKFIKEYQKFIDLPSQYEGNFKPKFNPEQSGFNPFAGIQKDTTGMGDSKLIIEDDFKTFGSKINTQDEGFEGDDLYLDDNNKTESGDEHNPLL